ncbi:hypothetical protein ACWDRB_62305 [Nonomuraea sp. NPDC003707]
MVVHRVEHLFRHPVPEVVRPALHHPVQADQQLVQIQMQGGPVQLRLHLVLDRLDRLLGRLGVDEVLLRSSFPLPADGESKEIEAIVHLAYLHIAFADPDQPVYQDIRKHWPGTLIANPILPADQIPADGGKQEAERLLSAGADLIALGRPSLANPDLVERLRTSSPVNPVRDQYLMYVSTETGYTDYPTLPPLGQETGTPTPTTA